MPIPAMAYCDPYWNDQYENLMKTSLGIACALFISVICFTFGCAGGVGDERPDEIPPSPDPAPVAAPRPASDPTAPGGRIEGVASTFMLSPAAQIQAEKFMCVCGCGMRLGACECEKDPGGITMKKHLQSLVEQGLAPREVSEEMVKRYGESVLPE